ncbi:DUF1648 domain-containing protein [Candidatus Contubernalis alkaliaceticus]|uniref:DUF1648 domain-containing protein n=1 Tax=Candidatus Contubernalis alkaliaceticus TaxID=338645 RepID=UPI001F4C27BD|nr:DUF1648 domain-containing protein [Candidatus Contubernalis alkalaceticus]UNC92915.1 DUF1648 domain-containing protein [Candidatus Contubernalis alkalaceticus]
MKTVIEPVPLSSKGKTFVYLNALGLVALWGIGIYAFLSLADQVPIHFDAVGKPTTYGNKLTLLNIAMALSALPIFFILLARYRFTLINKYPYLINLPTFFLHINKISPKRRGFWVNRYFEILLLVGVVLTFYLVALMMMLFLGAAAESLPSWFATFTIVPPLALLIPTLFLMRTLTKELKNEAGS